MVAPVRKKKRPSSKRLSLLIPVYNEEKNLERLVDVLESVDWPLEQEWIFVDDASRDKSRDVLTELAAKRPWIRLVFKAKNEGKSAALRTAIEVATGDIIAVQDADLEYDPRDLVRLAQPIVEGRADVVYGSRFRRDANQVHRTFHRYINVFLTLLSNFCSGIYLSDMESCYKVFRAEVLKGFRLQTNRFGFEPEITAYIAKFPLRILEFPISYFPRNYLEGKKIGWRDGLAALWFIFKFNYLVSAEDCLQAPSETKKKSASTGKRRAA